MDSKKRSIAAICTTMLMLAGCGFYDSVPLDTIFIDETYSAPVPFMNGDVEKIARVRCTLTVAPAGYLFRGTCHAALSNGVSDLLNDLHSGVDILDYSSRRDLNALLQERAGIECGNFLNREGLPVLMREAAARGKQKGYPALGDVVSDYIVRHNVGFRAYAWCFQAVQAAWDETHDNTHSGGHRCAVGTMTISVRDLEHPPTVTTGAFARDESHPHCPHARIVWDAPGPFNPYWGND